MICPGYLSSFWAWEWHVYVCGELKKRRARYDWTGVARFTHHDVLSLGENRLNLDAFSSWLECPTPMAPDQRVSEEAAARMEGQLMASSSDFLSMGCAPGLHGRLVEYCPSWCFQKVSQAESCCGLCLLIKKGKNRKQPQIV